MKEKEKKKGGGSRASCGAEMHAFRHSRIEPQFHCRNDPREPSSILRFADVISAVFEVRTRLGFRFWRTKTLEQTRSSIVPLFSTPLFFIFLYFQLLSRDCYSIAIKMDETIWSFNLLAIIDFVQSRPTLRNFSSACISQKVHRSKQNTELYTASNQYYLFIRIELL